VLAVVGVTLAACDPVRSDPLDPIDAAVVPDSGGADASVPDGGDAGCDDDAGTCEPPDGCGDGTIQAPERCDGSDLGGKTCADLGEFSGGTLACSPRCDAFVTEGCLGPPTVPRLVAPMNDAYFGSSLVAGTRRPTFQWAASTTPAGTIAYELQVSTDRGFGSGMTTSVTTGFINHRPAADLAVSAAVPLGARYYWRVRACAGDACSAFSRPHWVNVGRSDRDFNGDGFADVWVGAETFDPSATLTDAGRVFLYLGGANPSPTPFHTFDGEAANDRLSEYDSLAYAGDLNADGFADVIVGARRNDAAGTTAGRAYLFFGNAAASVANPIRFTGTAAGDQLGYAVGPAGDMNGDGFDDLLLGAAASDAFGTDAGAGFVYLGGATVDTTADLSFPGVAPATLGDVNGDGFADVMNPGAAGGVGGIYLGGAVLDATVDGPMSAFPVAAVGDVNGDGYGDHLERYLSCIPLGACTGMAYFTAGGPDVANLHSIGLGSAVGDYGNDLGSAGDFDGDGQPDVFVADRVNSQVLVFHGGATIDSTVDFTLNGTSTGEGFGLTAARVGDVNGDGRDDLAVAGFNSGKIHVYYAQTPANAVVDLVFSSPTGAGYGGALD
jgi:hypothetical protein